jgi:hypothetical protein
MILASILRKRPSYSPISTFPTIGQVDDFSRSKQADGLRFWVPVDDYPDQQLLRDRIQGLVGTIENSPSIDFDPEMGWSWDFDTNNEVFEFADNDYLSAFDQMSITAWVYRTGDPGSNWSRIVHKRQSASSDDWALMTIGAVSDPPYTKNALAMRINTTDVDVNTIAATTTIPLNEWTHVAATWDLSGFIRLYYNGLEVATEVQGGNNPTGNNIMNDAGLDMAIGCYWGPNTTRNFTGKIKDVRVYDRAHGPDLIYEMWHPNTRWELQVPDLYQFYTDITQMPPSMIDARNKRTLNALLRR